MEQFWDDIPQDQPEGDTLTRLHSMAKRALKLKAELLNDEKAIEEKKAELDRITKDLLPGLMQECNFLTLGLDDGRTITVKDVVKASITEAKRESAHEWLRQNGFDGIIKTAITAEFGRGEDAEAQRVLAALDQAGAHATVKESIHNATLTSFVKGELEKGTPIPFELFGVYQYKEAVLSKK